MPHAARATMIWKKDLQPFHMDSGHCVKVLKNLLSESDELVKSAKANRARITLLEKAAISREKRIATLENQKKDLEVRLER